MLNQKAAAFVPIATGWRQKSRNLFGSGADRLVPCRRETHVPYVNEARLGHFRSQVPAMVVVQAMILGLGRRLGSVESFQTQKMKSLLHRLGRWPRVAGEEEQRWWLGPADCLGRGWHPGERGRGRTPLMWLRSTCLRRWAAGAAPRILRRRCWFKPRTRWGS